MTADFVLARRETTYSDGRRPDAVEPGTLLDDLSRRDFTMNAIAKDAHGNLIDPFNGRQDIADKVIRAVGNARDRIIGEDALRGLRALRFAVQKGFTIDQEVMLVLASDEFREAIRSVSTERQREELDKMFKVNTSKSMELLFVLNLVDTLFDNTGLRLMPTMKG
jgi:tRNA nucleotidyltransferase (CCA-adding enzyme)